MVTIFNDFLLSCLYISPLTTLPQVLILTGDWRQTLPCSPDGRETIVGLCHMSSSLWHLFKIHHLNRNMRLANCQTNNNSAELISFDDFLKRVGDGSEGIEGSIANGRIVNLPEKIVYKGEHNLKAFGKSVFNELEQLALAAQIIFEECDIEHQRATELLESGSLSDVAAGARNSICTSFQKRVDAAKPLCDYLESRAILAATNATVAELNEAISELIHTAPMLYTASNVSADMSDVGLKLSTEDMSRLTIPGVPDHYLSIKPLMVVMIMRNLNQREGLCNGTRALVLQTLNCQLHVMIMGGRYAGKTHLIPYINFKDDRGWSFAIHRTQLPIRVGFAMTVCTYLPLSRSLLRYYS